MKRKTILFRIMAYNICMICFIGTIFSVSSYVTAYQKAVQLAQNSVNYHVQSIANYYKDAYEKMVNLVLNCAERDLIDLRSLGNLETAEERKKGLEYVKLISDFCAITGYGHYISRLTIFGSRFPVHISTGSTYSSTDDGKRIREAWWFERELQKDTYNYKLDVVESPFYREKERMIPIVIRNSDSGKPDWTALFVSPRLYQDKLEKDDNQNTVLVYAYTGQQIGGIGDLEGEDCRRLLEDILAKGDGQGQMEGTLGERSCFVSYVQDSRSGILVMEIMDMAVLKNDRLLLLQTVVFIFLACAGIGMTLSLFYGRWMKRPIDRLVDQVGKVGEGDFEPNPELESQDELGMIGKAINAMSSQIEELMREQLENEKEKNRLKIKMLQAQINPHFLYNTLDSIKWIAVIQKNSGIVKAVTALSKLLKNMSKGVDEHITLRQELDFVNDYVIIEKLKYAEMFDLKVVVEEEGLYDAKIVKLTLQPLVENAIFSGIEPGGKDGTILIRAYGEEGCLYVSVRDNGIGIPEEVVPQLLDHKEKLKGDRMSGIGLPNVDRRLKLIYGEEYGLSVESQMGKFTQITVKIPLEY